MQMGQETNFWIYVRLIIELTGFNTVESWSLLTMYSWCWKVLFSITVFHMRCVCLNYFVHFCMYHICSHAASICISVYLLFHDSLSSLNLSNAIKFSYAINGCLSVRKGSHYANLPVKRIIFPNEVWCTFLSWKDTCYWAFSFWGPDVPYSSHIFYSYGHLYVRKRAHYAIWPLKYVFPPLLKCLIVIANGEILTQRQYYPEFS